MAHNGEDEQCEDFHHHQYISHNYSTSFSSTTVRCWTSKQFNSSSLPPSTLQSPGSTAAPGVETTGSPGQTTNAPGVITQSPRISAPDPHFQIATYYSCFFRFIMCYTC
jgi:hypothetical protein